MLIDWLAQTLSSGAVESTVKVVVPVEDILIFWLWGFEEELLPLKTIYIPAFMLALAFVNSQTVAKEAPLAIPPVATGLLITNVVVLVFWLTITSFITVLADILVPVIFIPTNTFVVKAFTGIEVMPAATPLLVVTLPAVGVTVPADEGALLTVKLLYSWGAL